MFIAAIALAAGLSASPLPPQRQTAVTHAKTKALSTGTTIPVAGPYQLALDSQGNLYVANVYTNDVLIYNPSLVQQTARTISTNVDEPEGVTIDPYGNVFVANFASSQVTEYNASGQYLRAFQNAQVLEPRNIAVDALDDLYVLNTFQSALGTSTNVAVFQKDDSTPVSAYIDSDINVYSAYAAQTTSVAVVGSDVALAATDVTRIPGYTSVTTFAADTLVDGTNNASTAISGEDSAAALSSYGNIVGMAADTSGSLWLADQSHQTIVHLNAFNASFTQSVFLKCNYYPNGIAVDSVRGRVYVSDLFGNTIHVYNAQTAAPIGTLE
jgi:sugar lactone lactonase YvrE